ncbi:MAG: ATP synthase F0 subunit B [Pseudomonadota bacterium]
MGNFKINRQLLQRFFYAVVIVLVGSGFAWASSDGGHGAVHNAWTSNDTWKVLNFSILAIAVIIIGKKFLPEMLRSRAQGIEDEIKTLESKKADAQKKLAEYQAKFKNLDQESKQIVADYIKQGEDAKTRIIAEAKIQAEKLEEMAKRNIEQEFKIAKTRLQQEIVELAMAKAEEVVKASISSEDQDKLVDQYLKKVVA